MNARHFELFMRQLVSGGTRRGLLRLSASMPLAGFHGGRLDLGDTEGKKRRKKRRKKRKRKKCGKTGRKSVQGKCCAGSVAVDGVCQTCDVCADGCEFTSVPEAIEAASPGATIAACPGTFLVSESMSESVFFEKDLTIVGAGPGTDPRMNTILQGQETSLDALLTTTGQVVMQNLRIAGGTSGAIISTGSMKLIRCAFSDNGSSTNPSLSGGAITNSGDLTMTECTVSDNTAALGGGIFNTGTLTLIDSEISGNDATVQGGGIYTFDALGGGNVSLDAASRVTGNTAEDGGGIYNDGGTVELSTIANVSGNDPNDCGGDDVELCSG